MKIILAGACGSLGRAITNLAEEDQDFQIVLGFDRKASDQAAVKAGQASFPVVDALPENKLADVLIDFSLPAALDEILAYGKKTLTPLVLCATGYSEAEEEKIRKTAKNLPILKSDNLSVGINMMEKMVELLAGSLADFDIEIVESHHRNKADAPSGTALMLFQAANEGRGGKLKPLPGRSGHYDSRDENEVGISSLRGGSVFSDHSVFFFGQDEVLEIRDSVGSNKIFALGAIKAGRFLADRDPGFYTMADVLNA